MKFKKTEDTLYRMSFKVWLHFRKKKRKKDPIPVSKKCIAKIKRSKLFHHRSQDNILNHA